MQPVEALRERAERDLRLEAREGRADAVVMPVPERQVAVLAPRDVEPVGIVELFGIAVGGGEQDHRLLSLRDVDVTDRDVLQRHAARELHGRVIAQQLLDGAAGEERVGAQQLELLEVAQQGERAVADQVHGRFVPGDEEQDAGREQLGLAQLVAGFLRRDERAEQVVTGFLPPLLDELREVLRERLDRLLAALDDLRRQEVLRIE